MNRWTSLLALLLGLHSAAALAFDHDYHDYGALLQAHVHWTAEGHHSSVDYAGLKAERAGLQAVLQSWSAVSRKTFDSWSRAQQMAFLINAYNGFTLELILSRYPDLKSIRDLGSLLRSPWKQRFFTLLGEPRHLDWIEHETLRPNYPDARIHFAVNCASIGCPALRPEPFRAATLEAQLDDSTERFLRDRSRNRFDARRGELAVTKLLDWYGADFTVDGQPDPRGWLARHARWLGDTPAERELIAAADFTLRYTDYDWSLNDR
jgi:hypothetical protein